MPRKEVIIAPGDEVVIKVGSELKTRRSGSREAPLPSPRDVALMQLRNFVRSHVDGIRFLHSGHVEDVEDLTLDTEGELSPLLGQLKRHHVSQQEVYAEVQRALLGTRRTEQDRLEAGDIALRFMGYLATHQEAFHQLTAKPRQPKKEQ